MKPKPSKDLLSLMTIRDRMIVAKRFGEIEGIEKEIDQLRYKIKIKEDKKLKEEQEVVRGKLAMKHKAEMEHLKHVKQRELDVMMTKRERDFQFDHKALKTQRFHLEEEIGH